MIDSGLKGEGTVPVGHFCDGDIEASSTKRQKLFEESFGLAVDDSSLSQPNEDSESVASPPSATKLLMSQNSDDTSCHIEVERNICEHYIYLFHFLQGNMLNLNALLKPACGRAALTSLQVRWEAEWHPMRRQTLTDWAQARTPHGRLRQRAPGSPLLPVLADANLWPVALWKQF